MNTGIFRPYAVQANIHAGLVAGLMKIAN